MLDFHVKEWFELIIQLHNPVELWLCQWCDIFDPNLNWTQYSKYCRIIIEKDNLETAINN